MNTAKKFLMPKEHFPSWAYLLRVAARPAIDNSQNAPENSDAGSHFFFWARNALYYSLKALAISPRAHVLLPAYLCRAAVEPFLAYGSEVEFYNVGRRCEPDFSEIESKIRSHTEAVLVVHYFGFPQDISQFRKLCDRHKLCLIEDCAHVLGAAVNAQSSLGSIGDASVFSWRKFLPLYDGGELRLRRPCGSLRVSWQKETLPFTMKVAKSLLDQTLEQSPGPLAREVASLLETAKKAANRFMGKPPGEALIELDSDVPTFDGSLLNQPMSRPSRWLLRHSNVAAIFLQRRQNFLFLQERLSSTPGVIPLHLLLPDDVCPWVFPLFFEGVSNAHLLLRKEGIPAATWGGVRPAGVDSAIFHNSDFLYENLIFLPTHQNLTSEALDRIVAAVHKVRAATEVRELHGAYKLA